jgi:hypothetical protein
VLLWEVQYIYGAKETVVSDKVHLLAPLSYGCFNMQGVVKVKLKCSQNKSVRKR